jgi:predicted phosphohydrolase
MKLQIASDLHLEFADNRLLLNEHPLTVAGDVLLLAGDICLFGIEKYADDFFDWCSRNYSQTYIVPGNHEYYYGVDLQGTLNDFEYHMRDNVSYRNNGSVVIGDTELFFTTLWTIIPPLEIMTVQKGMTDCHNIVFNGKIFTANDYETVHETCVNWLTQALANSTAAHKVVVTHHCPINAEDPRYQPNGLSSAFIVPMENFIIDSQVDYWVFGHTHYNAFNDTKVGDTTIKCNQLGYVSIETCQDFKRDCVIDV